VPLPMEATFPLTMTEGFDGLYGLVIDSYDMQAGVIEAHVDVEDRHKQPAGLVHGGLFASIAEATTSMGTYLAVRADGKSAQGLSNQTSFLRPILDGTVHATARVRHRGRTTWVWEVEITDDQGRLCSLVRMTIAVRGD
jgi:1,4-dihydroxy-2-naphthoyl-CoA hydrolase